MRLSIIRQDYAPDRPTEHFLESALEALLERNVAISLVTRELAATRLQLIEQVVCNPLHLGRWWRDSSFARAACRAIRKAPPNLVESHAPLPCCDIYRADDGLVATRFAAATDAAPASQRWRIRAHPRWRELLAMERKMLASPWLRAVICPSPLVRDELRDRFGLAEDRLPVIPLPVDADALTPALRAQRPAVLAHHGIDETATVFLWSGGEWEQGGAHAAIEAVAALPPDAHLVLLGLPRHPEDTDALLRRLGLGARVVIIGQPPDPGAYYGAADAFVLPAHYDPQPRTTFEAMACALPVVVSRHSGAASLVRDHAAGIALASQDRAELVDAMRRLLDPGVRAATGPRSRQAILPFAPAAMTLKLVLLYRDLLAATVAPRHGAAASREPQRGEPHAPVPPHSAAAASRPPDEGDD